MYLKFVFIIMLTLCNQCSFAQITLSSSIGPAFYSKGDFRGNNFQIGVQKKMKRNLELIFKLGNFQFSKSDEYFYQKEINGPFDNIAEFRHVVLLNHLNLGANYYIFNKKFKAIIGLFGTIARTTTTSPQEYRIDFPAATGYHLPIYQIYYPDKFKKINLGPSAELQLQYAISDKIDLGLSLSYLQIKNILIWSLPLKFKYKIKN